MAFATAFSQHVFLWNRTGPLRGSSAETRHNAPPLNLAVVVSIMPSDLDLSSRLLDSQMHEIPQLICIPLHLHVCINYNY